MLHKEFWGLLFLAFVVWVFIAGDPNERIARACKPIGWTGNVITSMAALASPDYQQDTQRWFDGFEYGCRFIVWRTNYQEDNNAEQQKAAAAASAPSAASAASAASAPASGPSR